MASQDSEAAEHTAHRSLSLGYNPGEVDPTNLPFDQLVDGANMEEYTTETSAGNIVRSVRSRVTGENEDWKLVTFNINDPENPKNWSKGRKWYCTIIISFTCFIVAFASAVITSGLPGPMEDFHVSREVVLLTVTVFVIGFGVGPMIFAPLSEIIGRRPVYMITFFLALIFEIPCAVAPNIGTLIVCRAIDGIAFSAPMTLVGGSLSDLWRNEERGVPMAAFSAAPFVGPTIGPLVGGFLYDAAGWRWLYWIQLIVAGVAWVLISFTVPETYAPTLLKARAKKLRKTNNDPKYVTEQELDSRPLGEKLRICLFRPFQLLCRELIVFFVAVYIAVLYGLLYMLFIAYPIVYQEGKGYSPGITGLMFIPLALGVVVGAFFAPFVNKDYLKRCAKFNGRAPAELRLIPMMYSCWLIPVGLFIFAWTSYPDVLWLGPAISGFPIRLGFIFLYNSANNYLVDTYQNQAASALAAKTFLRSFWGAGCVLFTEQMYHKLGYEWASSLLAFLSLACCAIPYVFYFYGASIRRRSHYAYTDPEETTEKPSANDSSV